MYLKRIELQGFKSFANKTVLELKPGITAIIGPNGSGKSNISDAIKWVLGEQSIKELRGDKSEDIIFAGTQNRKSLGFAEVSIVLDNSDKSLPVEFSEVTVTRRLYRTGESGYYINKVSCRLKDIQELFMDTGIGKNGYSIIGQGKIDEILSSKSEDRRKIFEEAAGIVKYRVRRDETEKKLEQTKVNLMRINDILTEIESNLEPLKAQSDKARVYLELKEKLKNVEIGLYLYKIDNLKSKISKLDNDKLIYENQNKDESEKLKQKQQLKEELKNFISEMSEQIERLQNINFESKNEIEKINSNINISNERITNNIENVHRLEKEINEAKSNIEELKEDKENRETKRENLLKEREKFSKELEEKEEKLSEITKKLSTEELQNEDKKKQNEALIDKRYDLQNKITMITTNIENLDDRKKQNQKELDKNISELDEKRNLKNSINNEVNNIATRRDKVKKELQEFENKIAKINEKQQEFDKNISDLTDEKRLKTSKYNFLIETEREKEGYVKSVKSLLLACENNAELNKGINGVLANIISTDEKYQVAIEMALGASMQNIVTDTANDAKKMIEYLRKNNLGRASFLPISEIKGNKIKEFTKIDGVVGVASDLVKYDKKYENVILNLLGRTIVTKNIETAIKISKTDKHSYRIVTLEGDIINTSGSMTGGSIIKKTVNLLGRKNEIDKLKMEIENIDKKLEKIVTQKDEFTKQNEDTINQTKIFTEEMQNIEIELAKVNEKKNAIESEIEKISKSKEKFENEILQIENNRNDQKAEKENIEISIGDITEQINNLQAEIDEFEKLNKDNQEYIDNLNQDITDLKISVSSFDESNISMNEFMQRIDDDIKEEQNKIEKNTSQISEIEKNNEELKETIKNCKLNIQKIKLEASNSVEKIEELKEKKREKDLELEKAENEITSQFETIQKVKEGLIKVDSKRQSVSQDLNDTINDLWNDYEITPNNASEHYEITKNVTETTKEVDKLHEQIKDLGSINVDAIDEYKKAKERFETISVQKNDLEETMGKLKGVIQDLTENMKKVFKEKFALIQKYFNEVFVELFGGGKAELSLEDEENVLECGIDIKVQPTGKKLQNMLLLSGGERALTAICLLFAILKINPAPFCVLDEIEAALDDVNVYRYAEYLKKFSKTTQFIVITHRKGSMEAANSVYGVTMEENGVSKLLSISLK